MATAKLRHRSEVTEARFLRARDGDTIEVLLNCGFGVWLETAIRIVEIESWELDGPDEKIVHAIAAAIDEALRGSILTIHPCQGGRDKYGRLRARVYRGETNIGDWLIQTGRAWRVPPTHTHHPPAQTQPGETVEAKKFSSSPPTTSTPATQPAAA